MTNYREQHETTTKHSYLVFVNSVFDSVNIYLSNSQFTL
ncbi:DUF5431 family protein [Klebsiella pneumoniae]